MANKKSAQLIWTGEDWNFDTTLGSGYQTKFRAPNSNEAGGSPMEFLRSRFARLAALQTERPFLTMLADNG